MPSSTRKRLGIFRDVNEVNQIRGVRGVRRTIGIPHLLAISMIGRDQTGAAQRQDCRDDARDTFIDRFHRLDAGRDHAGMSDHVRIGKVQDDQVVTSRCARALRR